MIKKLILTSMFCSIIIFSVNLSPSEDRKQQIADNLLDIVISGGDHLGYSAEILSFLKDNNQITPSMSPAYSLHNFLRSGRDDGGVNIYSLLSGGLAIRESLQTDTIEASGEGSRFIGIKTLAPLQINSHPYSKMMKGKESKRFEIDRYVPEEFYSVHFSDTTSALDFFDYLNEVGGSLHSRYTMTPVEFNIKEKIMTQLALKENKEARSFYSSVIEEMTITGSDPFVIEGTDITLVIKVKSGAVFNTTIALYREEYKKKYNAEIKKVVLAGVEGEYITADHRRLNSVILRLPEDVTVISNSLKAAEMVVEAYQKKRRSLYDASDYIYMRSIYSGEKEKEDGFIYLSEAFIRHLVSPSLRISEARRMGCSLRLARLERFIIYCFQLTGKLPETVNDVINAMDVKSLTPDQQKLMKSIIDNSLYEKGLQFSYSRLNNWDSFTAGLKSGGSVDSSDKDVKSAFNTDAYIKNLRDFHLSVKGTPADKPGDALSLIANYTSPEKNYNHQFKNLSVINGTFSAYDKQYGRIGFMVPNIELSTEMVSKNESDNYKKFVIQYSSYWKEYFDPVGIRFQFNDGGISIETCILPLIENSLYNTLKELFGGAARTIHPDYTVKGDVMSTAFSVNIPGLVSLSELFDDDSDSTNFLNSPVGEIFSNEIQIHMGDVAPMIDIDGSLFSRVILDSSVPEQELFVGFVVWSFFHPLRVAIPVKKPDEALKFINIMLNTKDTDNEIIIKRYCTEYKNTKINVIKANYFGIATSRFYYCVKDGMLHITTTEKYMHDIIDTGKFNNTGVNKNIAAVFRPSEMIFEKESYRSGITESALETSVKNTGTIKLLGALFPESKGEELPDLAYKNFGFKPVCPFGGVYSIDEKGSVINSIYGNTHFPVLPANVDDTESSVILKRFFSTKEIRIEFEFTDEGIKTLIKTK